MILLLLAAAVAAGAAQPGAWAGELHKARRKAVEIKQRLDNPQTPPAERPTLEKERVKSLDALHDLGETYRRDPMAQIEVGRSFADAGDAERGIPFMERALVIVEHERDQKLKAKALTAAAGVYQAAGRYEMAAEKARQALEIEPGDREARGLYVTNRGRVSGGGGPGAARTSGRPQTDGSAAALRPERAEAAPERAPGGSGGARDANGRPLEAHASPRPYPRGTPITNPAKLEADRALSEARRLAKLDPKASLRYYDAAVAAHFKSAALRLERSRVRLEAGDNEGAHQDGKAAVELGGGAPAYAARARAARALKLETREIAADFQKAAELDPNYEFEYKAFVTKVASERVREPAPDEKKPKIRALLGIPVRTLALAAGAGIGLVIAGFALLRRRGDDARV